jgi:hypothetical protein
LAVGESRRLLQQEIRKYYEGFREGCETDVGAREEQRLVAEIGTLESGTLEGVLFGVCKL